MGVADDVGPRTVSNAVADPSIVAKDGICEVDGDKESSVLSSRKKWRIQRKIAYPTLRSPSNRSSGMEVRYSRRNYGRRLPGAAGLLERFRDGEDQFVFKWPADDLDADGQSLARNADGNGCAGKAGQVEPLRKPHGVAVARPGMVISLAVTKGGTDGHRGEQNRSVSHLAQNFGAEKIPIRAGFRELIEGN